MARAVPGGRFGMGLDHDPRAGVFVLRKDQHLAECRGAGAAVADRGIAARLVDHQHIRRVGGRRGRDRRRCISTGGACASARSPSRARVRRAVSSSGWVAQQRFEVATAARRRNARRVGSMISPSGGSPARPGQDASAGRHPRPAASGAPVRAGHRLAARGGGAVAPDADHVVRARAGPGGCHSPPASGCGGAGGRSGTRRCKRKAAGDRPRRLVSCPARRASVPGERIQRIGGVQRPGECRRASFAHCTKGASVT